MSKETAVEVKIACKELCVSRSGYYSWKDRPVSPRELSNEILTQKIRAIHTDSGGTYGLPRIQQKLKEDGMLCGKNRVFKLMRNAEISGVIKKRFKIQTTDSNHSLSIAPRVFKVEEPATHPSRANEVWVSDISYIPTTEGFLYLATYLDVFTRKVVGFAMDDQMSTSLIQSALTMALGRQDLASGMLITHSDRGSRYASSHYRAQLKSLKIVASMSRKGNCYDNSFAESFFATLKKELIYRKEYKNKQEAKKDIFQFIEIWYNRKRIHSSIGYMTPVQFEESLVA